MMKQLRSCLKANLNLSQLLLMDGEQMLIQTDNINQIKQVYEKYGRKA